MVFVYRIKHIFFARHMFTQFQELPLGGAGPRAWAGRKAGLRADGSAGGWRGLRSVFGVGRARAATWKLDHRRRGRAEVRAGPTGELHQLLLLRSTEANWSGCAKRFPANMDDLGKFAVNATLPRREVFPRGVARTAADQRIAFLRGFLCVGEQFSSGRWS